MKNNYCYCKELVLLGTTIAIELADNLTIEEVNLLSALLVVIGDQLALLSVCSENCETAMKDNASTDANSTEDNDSSSDHTTSILKP